MGVGGQSAQDDRLQNAGGDAEIDGVPALGLAHCGAEFDLDGEFAAVVENVRRIDFVRRGRVPWDADSNAVSATGPESKSSEPPRGFSTRAVAVRVKAAPSPLRSPASLKSLSVTGRLGQDRRLLGIGRRGKEQGAENGGTGEWSVQMTRF